MTLRTWAPHDTMAYQRSCTGSEKLWCSGRRCSGQLQVMHESGETVAHCFGQETPDSPKNSSRSVSHLMPSISKPPSHGRRQRASPLGREGLAVLALRKLHRQPCSESGEYWARRVTNLGA